MILALVCAVMWAVFFGLFVMRDLSLADVRSRQRDGSTRTDVFVPFHVTPYTQQKEDNHAA